MVLGTTKYLLELETEIKSIQDSEETKVRFQQLDEKIKKLEIAIKILSLQAELSSSN
ncbi:MAG TPA: hypothetical protein VD908_18415 [Cytophagales bacterium]|nr:hypothetical protein [Cytophagales bacterium]